MIIDELRTRATDGRVERSASLRWIGGEFRLKVEVPAGFQPPDDDATGYMLAALPLAMYRGEDLYVDGAVSPLVLRQTERIQSIYAAWDPAARRCRVRAGAELPVRVPVQGHGCLFSRGVDSMYSAIATDAKPLTHLIFCDTLAPRQDEQVRAQEWRLVNEASRIVGLPVLRISTNLRDPGAQLIDYQDMHGAGIAFMAHSLGGGLGRVVVPSGLTYSVAGPAGSHPLLDPLFGSEWLAFDHHGLDLGRPGKVAHIAAHRSELLGQIKVCFAEDTAGNCGRCRKCLWTMIALQAAGALGQASLFPDEIDLQALAAQRIPDLPLRLFWMQAAEALGDSPADRAVREAVGRALRRSARPSPAERVRTVLSWAKGEREWPNPSWSVSPTAQFRNHTNSAIAALRSGTHYGYGIEAATPQPVPAWSLGPPQPGWHSPPDPAPALAGVVRLLDRPHRRHRYSAGTIPAYAGAERVSELGALVREPADGLISVWITPEGQLATDRYEPGSSELDMRVCLRWVLAPVRWRELVSLQVCAREIVIRTSDALRAVRRSARPMLSRPPAPAGYLHPRAADERLPLYSSLHPVNGDQLLSTRESEAGTLGYCAPMLLGFLEAAAPVSGRLGGSSPTIPWASRFGQRG